MLKIWKHAWKKDESSRRPQAGQGSDQGAISPMSGTGNSASFVDVAEAVPPSSGEPILVPAVPLVRSAEKRPHSASLGYNSSMSPVKRPRTDLSEDSLRNHLPEIVDSSQEEYSPLSNSDFYEQVIEAAQRENTIAVLRPTESLTRLVVQMLIWAVDRERIQHSQASNRLRTALFVMDDDIPVDEYVQEVQTGGGLKAIRYRGTTPNPEFWKDLSKDADVVFISTNLLLECLLSKALTMPQVHFLFIGDVQSVQEQDSHSSNPIVKLMNDFYHIIDSHSRPHIFALALRTTIPWFQFDSAMLRLEQTLDAKVFGITEDKRSQLLALPDRPTEVVMIYDTPFSSPESPLYKRLKELDPSSTLLKQHFRATRYALADIGACAYELAWRRALINVKLTGSVSYEEIEDTDTQSDIELRNETTKVHIRNFLGAYRYTMPILDPTSRHFNVTPKFLRLVQILESCEVHSPGFRGVVFVQRRAIALVIVELLHNLHYMLGFLRPYAMVGHGPLATPEKQQETLRSFAIGAYNLLVCTKAAEDLDIPRASIVILFDLFESQTSHAYARARTRGRESHLVYMVERNNDAHRRVLSRITQLDMETLQWADTLRNSPGSSVPPYTLQETANPYHSDSDSDDNDDTDDYIKDATTSGRIYLQDATTVIYRFAAKVAKQSRNYTNKQPLFEFTEIQGEVGQNLPYTCTVLLPGTPFERITGPPASSTSYARRAACYQACWELSKIGLLDYDLFPLPSTVAADYDQSQNTHSGSLITPLDTSELLDHPHEPAPDKPSHGTQCYPRKYPDFWTNTASIPVTQLYPTIISTNHVDEISQPYAPMLILTRRPLPPLAAFKLFFSGIPAMVRLRPAEAFSLADHQFHDVYRYTLRVCRAISNKPFACSMRNMLYFFAPLGDSWKEPSSESRWRPPSVADHIPWDLVHHAAENWATSLSPMSLRELTEEIKDAIIQDKWVEFTRRYSAITMRPDLSPLSKPADSPREENHPNLFEYCKARRKGFETLQDFNQPLIEVAKVPTVLNRLNPTSRPPTVSSKLPAKYLIPELCTKFTIPASTWRTALLLPSITRRIEDILIVKELNSKFFDHAISEALLHAAVSAPAIGIEYDYERLELLGDSFLKYLSSIYVFVTNPSESEGLLHVSRQRIISNKSLLQSAVRAGLPPYIQAKPLTIKFWQPPNFEVAAPPQPSRASKDDADNDRQEAGLDEVEQPEMVEETDCDGMGAEAPETHESNSVTNPATDSIPENVQFDAVGASTRNNTEQPIIEHQMAPITDAKSKKRKKKRPQDEQYIQWLGDKAVADVAEAIIGAAYISGGRETALKATKALHIPIPHIDRWSDFSRKVLAPPPNVTAKLRPGSIEAVQGIIGHKFRRPHLLAQALTHSSIQGFESTSYERLEFIGDAILDFMVIRHIFDRDQQLSPGGLTLLKGSMVNNAALAAVCVWSGLHEHLLFESHSLAQSIQSYANQLKIKQTQEYEASVKEHRAPGQYWLAMEPPKALSDVVESIIGAIYISDNFSPEGAEALFDNVLKPFYDRHITLRTLAHHPTKILFELFQAQGCQQFSIAKDRDQDSVHCDVLVHDVILASAEDATATFAARMASSFALDAIEGDAEFLTRTCDCRTRSQTRKGQKKAYESLLSSLEESPDSVIVVDDTSVHRN